MPDELTVTINGFRTEIVPFPKVIIFGLTFPERNIVFITGDPITNKPATNLSVTAWALANYCTVCPLLIGDQRCRGFVANNPDQKEKATNFNIKAKMLVDLYYSKGSSAKCLCNNS